MGVYILESRQKGAPSDEQLTVPGMQYQAQQLSTPIRENSGPTTPNASSYGQ
jgi:hypothetical protein